MNSYEFFRDDSRPSPPCYSLNLQFIQLTVQHGPVVSSIPGSFPFVLFRLYTLHPRFHPFMYPTYSHKGTPYTYTSRIHMSSLAELAHIYSPVFPVTVLISLIENTNTAFTCIIDISSLPSTVTLKFQPLPWKPAETGWLEKERRGREGRGGKKETGRNQANIG